MKIKHFKLIKGNYNIRYLCNEAVITTPEKLTDNLRKVTCKNCRKIIKKYRKDIINGVYGL